VFSAHFNWQAPQLAPWNKLVIKMFEHLGKTLKESRRARFLFVAGIVVVIELIILLAMGVSSVHATPENENTFMQPIIEGDWWTAITSVYTNILGAGVFFGILFILPAGMLWIKLRNIYPPVIILLLGSSIFGVLIDSVILRLMIVLFIGFGVGVILWRTFTKSGGGGY